MTYTKQTWINGDVITAEKLNHIEDGVSQSGGLSIYETSDFFKDVDTISGAVIEDMAKDWPYVLKIESFGGYMIFHLGGAGSGGEFSSAMYSSGSSIMSITVGLGINYSDNSSTKVYTYNGTDYAIHSEPS